MKRFQNVKGKFQQERERGSQTKMRADNVLGNSHSSVESEGEY